MKLCPPSPSEAPPGPAPVATAGGAPSPHDAVADQPLPCPLCDYDLRGLAKPRCPECGYRFTWDEVLDPARRAHPYLFEHHPHRSAWAFFRTILGGLRPRRFWTSLLPGQPSRPRRIVFYWLLAAAPLIVAFVGSQVHRGWLYAKFMRQQRALMEQMIATRPPFKHHVETNFGSVQSYLDREVPRPGGWQFYRHLFRWQYLRNPRPFDKLVIVLLAWPWLTLGSLMVFQISMRRARIRAVHVARCVLYSADALLWVAVLAAPAVALQEYWLALAPGGSFEPPSWLLERFLRPPQNGAEVVIYCACLAGIALLAYRLTLAYRHYLRFDRPVATVLASQVVVFLVVWILVVNWGMR